MYLKAEEPLDEDRTQAIYYIYGETGASTMWCSGLLRRQGLALWAGGDEAGTAGSGIYYSGRHRGRSGLGEAKACIMMQSWLGATTAGIVGKGRQRRESWGLWAEGGKTFTRFPMSRPCDGSGLHGISSIGLLVCGGLRWEGCSDDGVDGL